MEKKNPRKILVTGARGLVGSRFVELFKNKYDIITVGRSNDSILLDLLNVGDAFDVIIKSDVEAVINFAACTQVDACENENNMLDGSVYIINSLLPLKLAEACFVSNKKLIHISTDYVLDGTQAYRPYKEDDPAAPVNSWYAKTKYWGEVNVAKGFKSNGGYAVVRISYPYNGLYTRKGDIARTVIHRLLEREKYLAVTDQKIKPISTDQIAKGLDLLMNTDVNGIYHLAGNFGKKNYTTPFKFAVAIAEGMNLDQSLITPILFKDFSLKRKSPRPQHTWLDTTKIQNLGMEFSTLDQELKNFVNQFNSVD